MQPKLSPRMNSKKYLNNDRAAVNVKTNVLNKNVNDKQKKRR